MSLTVLCQPQTIGKLDCFHLPRGERHPMQALKRIHVAVADRLYRHTALTPP